MTRLVSSTASGTVAAAFRTPSAVSAGCDGPVAIILESLSAGVSSGPLLIVAGNSSGGLPPGKMLTGVGSTNGLVGEIVAKATDCAALATSCGDCSTAGVCTRGGATMAVSSDFGIHSQ